jgi:hypothetical protein
MGFLDLLRLPEPVDWNSGRFPELVLLCSLKLITQQEKPKHELNQSY